ncbi:hypothetical protein GGX14DRAFT_572199 [Mycena pura]|uniref:Uncharacterized protein n=1 Tax=Mycena pura TaxID=153505 RepID=A0AAD6V519_9AGAR|nr:hypothetical protein GGX14DRAFT_572199 [Mycena pura]
MSVAPTEVLEGPCGLQESPEAPVEAAHCQCDAPSGIPKSSPASSHWHVLERSQGLAILSSGSSTQPIPRKQEDAPTRASTGPRSLQESSLPWQAPPWPPPFSYPFPSWLVPPWPPPRVNLGRYLRRRRAGDVARTRHTSVMWSSPSPSSPPCSSLCVLSVERPASHLAPSSFISRSTTGQSPRAHEPAPAPAIPASTQRKRPPSACTPVPLWRRPSRSCPAVRGRRLGCVLAQVFQRVLEAVPPPNVRARSFVNRPNTRRPLPFLGALLHARIRKLPSASMLGCTTVGSRTATPARLGRQSMGPSACWPPNLHSLPSYARRCYPLSRSQARSLSRASYRRTLGAACTIVQHAAAPWPRTSVRSLRRGPVCAHVRHPSLDCLCSLSRFVRRQSNRHEHVIGVRRPRGLTARTGIRAIAARRTPQRWSDRTRTHEALGVVEHLPGLHYPPLLDSRCYRPRPVSRRRGQRLGASELPRDEERLTRLHLILSLPYVSGGQYTISDSLYRYGPVIPANLSNKVCLPFHQRTHEPVSGRAWLATSTSSTCLRPSSARAHVHLRRRLSNGGLTDLLGRFQVVVQAHTLLVYPAHVIIPLSRSDSVDSQRAPKTTPSSDTRARQFFERPNATRMRSAVQSCTSFSACPSSLGSTTQQYPTPGISCPSISTSIRVPIVSARCCNRVPQHRTYHARMPVKHRMEERWSGLLSVLLLMLRGPNPVHAPPAEIHRLPVVPRRYVCAPSLLLDFQVVPLSRPSLRVIREEPRSGERLTRLHLVLLVKECGIIQRILFSCDYEYLTHESKCVQRSRWYTSSREPARQLSCAWMDSSRIVRDAERHAACWTAMQEHLKWGERSEGVEVSEISNTHLSGTTTHPRPTCLHRDAWNCRVAAPGLPQLQCARIEARKGLESCIKTVAASSVLKPKATVSGGKVASRREHYWMLARFSASRVTDASGPEGCSANLLRYLSFPASRLWSGSKSESLENAGGASQSRHRIRETESRVTTTLLPPPRRERCSPCQWHPASTRGSSGLAGSSIPGAVQQLPNGCTRPPPEMRISSPWYPNTSLRAHESASSRPATMELNKSARLPTDARIRRWRCPSSGCLANTRGCSWRRTDIARLRVQVPVHPLSSPRSPFPATASILDAKPYSTTDEPQRLTSAPAPSRCATQVCSQRMHAFSGVRAHLWRRPPSGRLYRHLRPHALATARHPSPWLAPVRCIVPLRGCLLAHAAALPKCGLYAMFSRRGKAPARHGTPPYLASTRLFVERPNPHAPCLPNGARLRVHVHRRIHLWRCNLSGCLVDGRRRSRSRAHALVLRVAFATYASVSRSHFNLISPQVPEAMLSSNTRACLFIERPSLRMSFPFTCARPCASIRMLPFTCMPDHLISSRDTRPAGVMSLSTVVVSQRRYPYRRSDVRLLFSRGLEVSLRAKALKALLCTREPLWALVLIGTIPPSHPLARPQASCISAPRTLMEWRNRVQATEVRSALQGCTSLFACQLLLDDEAIMQSGDVFELPASRSVERLHCDVKVSAIAVHTGSTAGRPHHASLRTPCLAPALHHDVLALYEAGISRHRLAREFQVSSAWGAIGNTHQTFQPTNTSRQLATTRDKVNVVVIELSTPASLSQNLGLLGCDARATVPRPKPPVQGTAAPTPTSVPSPGAGLLARGSIAPERPGSVVMRLATRPLTQEWPARE